MKNIITLFFLFTVFFSLCQPVQGHEVIKRVLDAKNGLNGIVNDITFDENGFAWAATERGLYRVLNTQAQRVDKLDSQRSLYDERILRVESIGNGQLILSTLQQIFIYNIAQNKFYPFHDKTNSAWHSKFGLAGVVERKDGSKFVLSICGQLWLYKPKTDEWSLEAKVPFQSNYPWKSMELLSDGNLLLSSEYHLMLVRPDFTTQQLEWNKSMGSIEALHQDKEQQLWIATSEGLFSLNSDDYSFKSYSNITQPLFSITSDLNGVLWLATEQGVLRWLPSDDYPTHIHNEHHDALSVSSVRHLFSEPTGLIWGAGNQAGVTLIAEFTHFLTESFTTQPPYKMSEQEVWSVYAEDQTVWVGAANMLLEMNRTTKTSKTFAISGLELRDRIYGIKPLSNNALLLLTTDGLYVFDKSSATTMSFAKWNNTEKYLEYLTIYSAVHDSSNNIWWFATNNGLYFWEQAGQELQQFMLLKDGVEQHLSIRSLLILENGDLWVGGENVFGRIKNNVFTSYHRYFDTYEHMPVVEHLSLLADGKIWLGTNNNGLLSLDLKQHRLLSLTDKWRSQCNSVYFIEHTAKHKLIGCNDGILLRYDHQTQQVSAFDKNDGLLMEDMNEGAIYYQPDVGAFIGMPRGLMLLDIANMHHRIEDDGVFLGSSTVYYQDSILLNLAPRANNTIYAGASFISFQLASHDYLDSDIPYLQYRLRSGNGDDSDALVSLMGHSQINLSGIDAGQYTLELISGKNGIMQEKPYRYQFTVEEPWWHAKQFKMLMVLVLFFIISIVIITRQRRVHRIHKLNFSLQETQERLGQALRGSDSDLWEWHTNEKQLHLGDYSRITKEGAKSVYRLDELQIHDDDIQQVLMRWQEMIDGKTTSFEAEYRHKNSQGEWRWIRSKGRPVKFNVESQEIEVIAGIFSDITEAKVLEARVNLLAQAFEHTSEALMLFDSDGKIIESNPAALGLLGANKTEDINQDFCEIFTCKTGVYKQEDLLKGKLSWSGEKTLFNIDGNTCPVWLHISRMYSKSDKKVQYVVAFSDMTQRKSAEKELIRIANYDALTGLPNRTLFSSELLKAVEISNPNQQKMALMFLDLDRFKNINDSFGHSMGDALLVEAATRLSNCIGEHGLLCRFGGDEFVVVIKQVNNIEEVNDIAEAMLETITKPFQLSDREFFISTSIGISLWPEHGTQPEALIKNADLAMYHAKEEGRGNYKYYSAARNQQNLYHLYLEAELRKAIEKQQLELHYQVQIDILNEDKIVGMEALLRWNHPEEGMVRPDIFIEIAENSSLIIDIDRWVLTESFKQIAQWQQQFSDPFRLSINVSASHFRQPDFVDTVKQVMLETGALGRHIGLEITEGVLMKEVDNAQHHLAKLQKLGIEIAIDDFGTGYSSLAYLRHFAVNTLKIDRKFVIDIAHNSADQAIVNSIVELARNLKLKVVAEGIETYEQLEHLVGRGCYLMQGYYFSKPLPIAEMQEKLNKTYRLKDTKQYEEVSGIE
ncbi:MAG: EAL domain-containing protein [Parashewanella sp.]